MSWLSLYPQSHCPSASCGQSVLPSLALQLSWSLWTGPPGNVDIRWEGLPCCRDRQPRQGLLLPKVGALHRSLNRSSLGGRAGGGPGRRVLWAGAPVSLEGGAALQAAGGGRQGQSQCRMDRGPEGGNSLTDRGSGSRRQGRNDLLGEVGEWARDLGIVGLVVEGLGGW